MISICGIYSPRDPSRLDTELLASMAAAIGIPSERSQAFVERQHGLGLAGASFVAPSQQREAAYEVVVGLTGSLYGAQPDDLDSAALTVQKQYVASPATFPLPLDGHFSVAVWDSVRGDLVLASDTFASHPLFYYCDEATGYFAFASQLKALLEHPGIGRAIDRDALALYLRFGYVPPPWTMLRSIRRLLPFERLAVHPDGSTETKRYYRLPHVDGDSGGVDQWAPRLREELTRAVGRMAHSGRPVGVLLSGGVDSTAVLAAVRESHPHGVAALTLGYKGHPSETELDRAALVASAAGVSHTKVAIEASAITPRLVSQVFRRFDGPAHTFNRGMTQHFLTAAAREQGIDLCLSGHLGENIIGEMLWPSRLDRVARDTNTSPADELLLRVFAARKEFFSGPDISLLLGGESDGRAAIRQMIDSLREGVEAGSDFTTYMNLTALLGSTGALCMPARSISPMNGVEDRPAFADRGLLEFTQTIPANLKGLVSRSRDRALLRAAFLGQAPSLSSEAPEKAFPSLHWWEVPWLERLAVMQVQKLERENSLVAPAAATRVLRKYARRKARRDLTSLWHLFVLQTWFDLTVLGIDPFEETTGGPP